MAVLENYYQGESFRQKAQVTDVDAVDTDPNTITITIRDSAGTLKVTADGMTKETIGQYYYDYEIPGDAATGEWTSEVYAEKTKKAIEHDWFLVLEAL